MFHSLAGLRLGPGGRGLLPGGAATAIGSSTPPSRSIERQRLLKANCMLALLESDSSDEDCGGHHRIASAPRTIVAEPAYASSLYHDDACLSPRHVHKVSGRQLGGVYQTLSFDAACFHTLVTL